MPLCSSSSFSSSSSSSSFLKDSALRKARGENDHLKLQLKALLGGGAAAPQLRTSSEEVDGSENTNPNGSGGLDVEATSSLPPSPSRRRADDGGHSKSYGSDSPAAAALAYDKKIVEAMKNQVDEMKHRLELADAENKRIKASCTSREREVERLSALLEGGRDYDRVSSEHDKENSSRMLDQLNRQVDFLNSMLAEREGQLSTLQSRLKSTDRVREEAAMSAAASKSLQEQNANLSSKLADVSQTVAALEQSNAALKAAAEKARRSASNAKHELGVRDSAGSLPGSVSSAPQSPRSPYASGARRRADSSGKSSPSSAQAWSRDSAEPSAAASVAASKVTKLQKEITELRIALSSAEAEANQLNADNDRLAEALDLTRQESDAILKSSAAVGGEADGLKSRLIQAEMEKNKASEAFTRAAGEAANLRDVAERMTVEISSLQERITEISDEKEGGGKSLERLRSEVAGANEMLAAKESDIKNLTNALRESHAELRETRRKFDENASELNELREKHGEQQNAAESIKFAAERAKTEAQEATMMAGGAKRAVQVERGVRERLEQDLEEIKGKERVARARVKSLEDRLSECEGR